MQSVGILRGLFVGLAMACLFVSSANGQTAEQTQAQEQTQTQAQTDSQTEAVVSPTQQQPVVPRVKYNSAPDWENFRRLQQEEALTNANGTSAADVYFSEEKRAQEQAYQQRILKRKQYWEEYDQTYKGGFGAAAGYLERYDYNNSRQPYKGMVLSGFALKENAVHKFEFSLLDSELEALGPGNPRPATRHWDLVYTYEDFEKYSQVAHTRYFLPAVGVRLKESLTVTCKNKRSHCFYTTHEDWDIQTRSDEVLPLIGFVTGFAVYNRYLHMDLNFNLLSDTDSIYLGWALSLGGVYAR